MLRTLPLLCCWLILQCSGKSAISTDQYVRFTAKQKLIQEHYKNKPDSLALYMAGLYKSEGVKPEGLKRFRDAVNAEPKEWIALQQKIVAELEKLNPAQPAKVPSQR